MGRAVKVSGSLFEGCATDLLREFRGFHRSNPFVFRLFKQLAFQAKEQGRRRYSHQAIWHILRWNFDLPTHARGVYKLSNNYIALYARLAIKEHPRHFGHGFFRLRPFGARNRRIENDQSSNENRSQEGYRKTRPSRKKAGARRVLRPHHQGYKKQNHQGEKAGRL
jgi:hypothetical protein